MTNNPTIDGVSRELIERIARDQCVSAAILDQLRALLDREVITDDHLRQRIAFLTSEVHARAGERDALQSTIAQLQARVQELESGRGEPAAWQALGTLFKTIMGARNHAGSMPIYPLYYAPPAPVAVVLPERATAEDFGDESMANGWNACLDAATALNNNFLIKVTP